MRPHDALPDNLYARVGEKPAEAAREDFGTARAIGEGECALDGDRPFRRARADEQLEALKGVEGSDFLELVRSTAVVEVYSDRRTWQVFG